MCFLNIVVPVRDRWNWLKRCLESLVQTDPSISREIIVVDDGSKQRPPPEMRSWVGSSTIKYVRQVPLGVAAARNRGVSCAKGDIVLFVDSDCKLRTNCLLNLAKAVHSYPDDVAFQLRIIGDMRTYVGAMENLRVTAAQQSLRTEDGYIRYANTSAFGIRRSYLDGTEFFDTSVARGEDSLVLMKLACSGRLPRYVPDAIVEHLPEYTPWQYILKHFCIGYQTGPARQKLRKSQGILMSPTQRWKMFRQLREIAADESALVLCPSLVLLAYGLEVFGRLVYRIWGIKPGRTRVLSTFVDRITR